MRDEQREVERDVLRHTLILLFSFADLAEQASVRSWRVRRDLLAILRKAETAAFWTVADAARDHGAPLPAAAVAAGRHWKFDDDGDDPENALRLAHRFRALALALTCLLALAEQIAAAGGMRWTGADSTGMPVTNPVSFARLAGLRASAIRAPPSPADMTKQAE